LSERHTRSATLAPTWRKAFQWAVQATLEVWRHEGMAGLYHAFRIRAYLRTPVTRWRMDLTDWRPGKGIPTALVVRRGSPEELERFRAAFAGGRAPLAFYADRIHGASRFYIALWEGHIVHITWVFTQADRTSLVELGSDEVEVRLAHTLKGHRRLGIFTATLQVILDDLKSEGVRTVFGHVRDGNTAVQQTFAKLGFQPVGILHYRWLLGIPLTRYEAGAGLSRRSPEGE